MLEWYEAYADYNDAARPPRGAWCRTWPQAVGIRAARSTSRRLAPRDASSTRSTRRRASTCSRTAIRDALAAAITARGLELKATEELTWPQLVDDLLSKHVEPTLIQPTIVVDYPVELSPFAKAHREHDGPDRALRGLRAGMEIANAFTELNDPDEQRERFEAQARLAAGRRGGPALRRAVRAGARAGHAAHRRTRARHRPAGDAHDGDALDPRGRAVPGHAGLTRFAGWGRRRSGGGGTV